MARKDQGVALPARTGTGPERFPSLDGVRAVAALGVVLTHVGFQSGEGIAGAARTVLSRLDAGVAVFFVLSGFLLHLPQARAALSGGAPPAVVPYLWRRALRILPAYWVAVTAAMLLLPENAGAGAAEWTRQLTLTHVYVPDGLLPGLTHTWSLATEVSFYLALPLLGRLAGRTVRRQLALCGAMVVTGVVWQGLAAAGPLPLHSAYWLPGHADWFGLGMGLAVLTAAGTPWLREVALAGATCWAGAAALFVVAGTPLTGPYRLEVLTASEIVSRTLLYGAIAVLVVLPATLPLPVGPVARVLASPLPAFLGRVSYGIFLFHLTALALAFRLLDLRPFTGHFGELTAWVVLATVAVSWASLRVIEDPVMRLRTRGPGARKGALPRPVRAR